MSSCFVCDEWMVHFSSGMLESWNVDFTGHSKKNSANFHTTHFENQDATPLHDAAMQDRRLNDKEGPQRIIDLGLFLEISRGMPYNIMTVPTHTRRRVPVSGFRVLILDAMRSLGKSR